MDSYRDVSVLTFDQKSLLIINPDPLRVQRAAELADWLHTTDISKLFSADTKNQFDSAEDSKSCSIQSIQSSLIFMITIIFFKRL